MAVPIDADARQKRRVKTRPCGPWFPYETYSWSISVKLSLACVLSPFVFLLLVPPLWSDDVQNHERAGAEDRQALPFNLATPTLGGAQLWTDELIFRKWRIQKNAITRHYRLLDDENHRRAWGTFDECHGHLRSLREKLPLAPIEGEVVLILHGLGRTRASMAGMCKYLERGGGFTVLNMSYATTRGTIDDHADSLARVVENLDPGVTDISFVAHSLGNIVIRRFLDDYYRRSDLDAASVRIKRIVMLGPPNKGSELAQRFPRSVLVRWIGGGSTVDLANGWQSLQKRLATPRCQFGIIAGGQGDEDGRNALLQGDDDLVVTVQETKLPGAQDFVVLPVYHGTIMLDKQAREHTLRFLQHGYFRTESDRQPIESEETAENDGG